jgi:alpha-L-arabinofuranosidase
MMGLYATRERCESLKVAVESGTFTVSPARPGNFAGDAPYLDVSARLRDEGRQVDVFVVNRNLEEAVRCAVELVGGAVEPEVEVATLEAEDIHMWNGFDEPDKVRVTTKTVDIDGTTLEYPFAKHSVTKLTFRTR